MNLAMAEYAGARIVEAEPNDQFLRKVDDVGFVVEACFSNKARCVVLYATNLTPGFFDLSSGEAGAILQKLRQYRIRLAVVCPTGTVKFSTRFGEMVEEEARGIHFRIFETAEAAREWLASTAVPQ